MPPFNTYYMLFVLMTDSTYIVKSTPYSLHCIFSTLCRNDAGIFKMWKFDVEKILFGQNGQGLRLPIF